MKRTFLQQTRAAKSGAVWILLLVVGCTGKVAGDTSSGGQNVNPGGSGGGSASPGSGGTKPGGSGGASSGSGGARAGTGGTVATGGNGGTTDPGTIVVDPPSFAPAPGLLRRLTRTQFRNAMNDIFGYAVDISRLDTDSFEDNFASIGASVVVTSDQGAEQYNTAVESAVDLVFSDATKRSAFMACTPTGMANDTCLRGYIQKLGLRAWRRPLTTAELDGFGTLSASATTTMGSAVEGARWATVALFESPNFVYRPELGATTNGSLRYGAYEMAERLSFLIWNSIPDQMLLDQAAGGMLATADGIRTAATRMLGTTQGRESVGNFAEEFLRLDRITTQAKDPALFTTYGPTLQAAMVRDVRDTWASLVFDDQTSVMDLFTTTKAVVNSDLASLYGLDTTGLTSTKYKTVSLPANGARSGILSKAGLLSEFANQQSGSPTLRGKFIRESLLCQTVPPPPPGVNTAGVDQPTDVPMTKRQRLEIHRSDSKCSGCHALMDPLGLPLESFDAIGAYRTTDNGLPVDPTSTFDGQAVADSRALGVAASQSVTVAQCLVRRFYAYAVGYPERAEDGSVLNSVAATFNASGSKMRDLILAVVTSDAFSSVAPQP
jgi:hypothetical protein